MPNPIPSPEDENFITIQQQIAIRDLEVNLLRKELEEKKRIIQDLSAPHLLRERSLENEAQSLELELDKSSNQLSQMQHELSVAENMLSHYQEKEKHLLDRHKKSEEEIEALKTTLDEKKTELKT